MKYYRIVSDYGFGDKTWIDRMIPESEILVKFNEQTNRGAETIEQAEDSDFTYYIEEDSWDDTEDWDWQDS